MKKIFSFMILSFVLISTAYSENWELPFYSKNWEPSLDNGYFQSVSIGDIESGDIEGMLLVVSDETSSSVNLFISKSSYQSLKNKNQVGVHGVRERPRGQAIEYNEILDVKWKDIGESYMATTLYYDDSEDVSNSEMSRFLSSGLIYIAFNPEKEPLGYSDYVTGTDELRFSVGSGIFGYGFTVDVHIYPLVQLIRDYEEREYWWGVLMMD